MHHYWQGGPWGADSLADHFNNVGEDGPQRLENDCPEEGS